MSRTLRQALVRAAEHALGRGASVVETSDALAALRDVAPKSIEILTACGCDLPKATATAFSADDRAVPYSSSLRRALDHARAAAQALSDDQLGTSHLCLGLAAVGTPGLNAPSDLKSKLEVMLAREPHWRIEP